VVDRVVETYKNCEHNHGFDVSDITDYEKAKENVFVSVRNGEMNQEQFANIPHEEVGDLAVTYRVHVDMKDLESWGTVLVTNDILKQMGVDEDTLRQDAWKNTKEKEPYTFQTLGEVIKGMMGPAADDFPMELPQIYVLSNTEKHDGAVYLCDKETLGEIADRLQDDLVILPSSIHECLVLPASTADDLDYLKGMVEAVNEQEVSPAEKLSDNVYQFDAATQELTVYTGQSETMDMK